MSARTSGHQAKSARTKPLTNEGVPIAKHAPHAYTRKRNADTLYKHYGKPFGHTGDVYLKPTSVKSQSTDKKIRVTERKVRPDPLKFSAEMALSKLDAYNPEELKRQRKDMGMSSKDVRRARKQTKESLYGFNENPKGLKPKHAEAYKYMQRVKYKDAKQRADKARKRMAKS